MHTLRTATHLPRLLLAWFVCALFMAGLSPIVHPKAMQIICSADGGLKLMALEEGGQADLQASHTLDCALCLPAMVPPPPTVVVMTEAQPLAHALKPAVQAHIAALVGAPLPPRGPPSLA